MAGAADEELHLQEGLLGAGAFGGPVQPGDGEQGVRVTWAHSFFGCCSYSPVWMKPSLGGACGRCIWFPSFLPKAVNSPPSCCIYGQNVTAIHDEDYLCDNKLCELCQCGPRGCCAAVLTSPVALCSPLPISPMMALLSLWQREQVARKLGIAPDPPAGACWRGLCYPCALTQVNTTLRELRARRKMAAEAGVAAVEAVPEMDRC